jgi:hypothetical protein
MTSRHPADPNDPYPEPPRGDLPKPAWVDEFACASCGGMGFKKVWDMHKQPTFPECSACGGSGAMTETECEAFRNRHPTV